MAALAPERTATAALEIAGLRKVFDNGVVALDGVDLTVRRGEILGVVGRSGAGKSTLIRCVNRLEEPTAGSIRLDGRDIARMGGAELRAARRGIGMVFQHFNLLSSRTAVDNVALPLEIAGAGRAERRRRAAELLELVGLSDRASAYPAQLSGGQKQRVGIARALAGNPSVLLSDEATSALDAETTGSVLELLRTINAELGLTVLLITHEMDVVRRVCDAVALIADGRIAEAGPLGEIVAEPGSALARGLLPPLGRVELAAGERAVEAVLVDDHELPALDDARVEGGAIERVGGRRVARYALVTGGDPERLARELRAAGAHAEVAA
jgi:D-methionine transport system ATP-binding protein